MNRNQQFWMAAYLHCNYRGGKIGEPFDYRSACQVCRLRIPRKLRRHKCPVATLRKRIMEARETMADMLNDYTN